jgi:hypothetical protein
VAEKDQKLEVIDAELVEEPEGNSVSLMVMAEADQRVATAKKYPRSITEFMRRAIERATIDEETAATMWFSLPRGGKQIEGPSIRLAEVCFGAWKNSQAGTRVIAVEEKMVRVAGMAWDMEDNTYLTDEVTRRITNRDGKRFNDDMIQTTIRATASIARRNAIFGIVPRAYVNKIMQAAKQAALGKGTMEQRVTKIKEEWALLGANQDQVLKLIHRKGWSDLSLDDVLYLKGLRTAIIDKEISLNSALEEVGVTNASAKVVVTPETLMTAQAVTTENNSKSTKKEEPKPIDSIPDAVVSPEDKEVASLFSKK